MPSASFTNQFKRDVALAIKRGKNIDKLSAALDLLLAGKHFLVNLVTIL
jgi:mRNA-degrading endonuclease YafQ of YafQ-DinJ toxin-antitoxin module